MRSCCIVVAPYIGRACTGTARIALRAEGPFLRASHAAPLIGSFAQGNEFQRSGGFRVRHFLRIAQAFANIELGGRVEDIPFALALTGSQLKEELGFGLAEFAPIEVTLRTFIVSSRIQIGCFL